MYTLILMSAMSATPDAADFNGFFRNLFSFNGHSREGLFHRGESNSRTGGCAGSQASSTGSCTGNRAASTGSCTGAPPAYARAGCTGTPAYTAAPQQECCAPAPTYVSSGCTGNANYSCFGSTPMMSYPDAGGMGGYAVPQPAAPSNYFYYPPLPFSMATPPTYAPSPMYASAPPTTLSTPTQVAAAEPIVRTNFTTTASESRGTVVVRLPADAALFAENRKLNLTGNERRFVTPVLNATADYEYNFRVEYTRNGETISRSKSTTVRAGATALVEFDDNLTLKPNTLTSPKGDEPKAVPMPSAPLVPQPAPVYAGTSTTKTTPERAKITVKLLPGTTLYIDGRKNDRTELVREFNTPPVPPGQDYAYVMKAEIVRNGHPETQTMKVPFRAGETQHVDFTYWPGNK